jgi:membrane-associated phospholipid phosphatase
MAASRVYVGAHRPGDVVAGAALGAVTGAAAGTV